MKKVMVVFGTRPEAIKMCPLVIELKKRKNIEVFVCVSGQHRELLDSVMSVFGIKADFDLEIMTKDQSLFDITAKILDRINGVLNKVVPDIVLVHGDTSTAFAAALASFYMGIPVGHVEAGLRSNDILEPFPEELNRRAITLLSKYDFSPTLNSYETLLNEGKEKVFLTGNTVLDSFGYTIRKDYDSHLLGEIENKKMILLTTHRRENVGAPMHSIFSAVRRIADERNDICFICPLHPNAIIRKIAEKYVSNCQSIRLCEPLGVVDFHNILARCYFAVSDSGGVQEEGVALGKPVLVLRNKTERPEGVACGGLKLVGTNEDTIYKSISELLDDDNIYKKMVNVDNPFGDGKASQRIADIIEKEV